MDKISIIVPAYNEAKTIGNLVRTLTTFKCVNEILIVNDGSTDETANILLKTKKELPKILSEKMKIYNFKQNRGHGYACCYGVKKAKNPILVFLDADITSILEEDIVMMIAGLTSKKAEMVLGIEPKEKVAKFSVIFDKLTGERALWRKDIIDKLAIMKKKKYGFVIFLNSYYEGKKVLLLHLPSLYFINKMAKMSTMQSIKSYAKEVKEMAEELLKQKFLSPEKARAVIRKINGFING